MERRAPEFGLSIEGPVVLLPTPHRDERGLFARLSCPQEFAELGIAFSAAQTSLSRNPARHTLRGMHYQPGEWAEGKIIRATRGAAFDVAVDLRPESPTYLGWCATRLSAESMAAFFIPRGFAHGFLTLEPDTDIVYEIDRPFEAGHGAGLRWSDPMIAIDWPAEPAVIGERDAGYVLFDAALFRDR
ncbi:dTDP-4-dehydrorhamnose 3,5-epimerase family protein [Pleomorphomonas sp. JP5]|uniref:dTDP-4-dehydrorhamnose 3,5-epimerase family protein n=1 Tax=Pleomorphomonas sp. JP5 TaxID=2942998 RepID=UPI002043689F|nr:dTDP-4-dehydrorhamnose 3,5-epimerase family protein [Pleomorphomonas sp. JP5]MCM5557655.1 dTDP-4-dehydrorhamnose 3,5-epimerase family protein [Pleomorphomonas sp. JP5]